MEKKKKFDSVPIIIPFKMREFFKVEISIYSLPGFFIYFVRRFFIKLLKCRYLHEINANHSGNKWSISTHFCLEKWYFHCTREKMMDWGTKSSFFHNLGKLWKCHSHYFNDQNIHLFPERIAFISCKYLHFICFVENLWTK